jgi:hypothetical protein
VSRRRAFDTSVWVELNARPRHEELVGHTPHEVIASPPPTCADRRACPRRRNAVCRVRVPLRREAPRGRRRRDARATLRARCDEERVFPDQNGFWIVALRIETRQRTWVPLARRPLACAPGACAEKEESLEPRASLSGRPKTRRSDGLTRSRRWSVTGAPPLSVPSRDSPPATAQSACAHVSLPRFLWEATAQ